MSCNLRCVLTTTSKSCGRLHVGRRPRALLRDGNRIRMRVRIVALGQRMPAWIRAGYEEYAKRMPREYALELIELKAVPRDRGKSVNQMLAAEAAQIRTACANDHVVALDERGSAWTTRDLAAKLTQWRDNDVNVAFAIGSADGLDGAF